MRRVLLKDLLLISVAGCGALCLCLNGSHWLVGTISSQRWAGDYNRMLLGFLLGAFSNGAQIAIPKWLPIVLLVTLLPPLWRRMPRLRP